MPITERIFFSLADSETAPEADQSEAKNVFREGIRPVKPAIPKCAVVLLVGVFSATLVSAAPNEVKNGPSQSAQTSEVASKFFSPEDGWLDISGFLDQAYGFVPLAVPITEPAVGYGAAGALVFIDKPKGGTAAGLSRPNISVLGGLGTENGTRGAFAGDLRHWMGGRLQTLVGAIQASVNLDFYGIGADRKLKDHPLGYNLEPKGGVVQARYRFGDSPVWTGLGYVLAVTKVGFDPSPRMSSGPDFDPESRVGGLLPSLTYDSRDNFFTPIRGTYLDASAGLFSPAFGGDDDFQRLNLIGIHFLPLDPQLTLGVRASATFSSGDVPFYLRPFIALRGVPAMRYQGEHTAQVEAELRWQFWQRFSLVGFAGAGAAWNDFDRLDNLHQVLTGGGGFRYELARRYGLHMGLDVAFGPDDPAIYVQFGSAWIRP